MKSTSLEMQYLDNKVLGLAQAYVGCTHVHRLGPCKHILRQKFLYSMQ